MIDRWAIATAIATICQVSRQATWCIELFYAHCTWRPDLNIFTINRYTGEWVRKVGSFLRPATEYTNTEYVRRGKEREKEKENEWQVKKKEAACDTRSNKGQGRMCKIVLALALCPLHVLQCERCCQLYCHSKCPVCLHFPCRHWLLFLLFSISMSTFTLCAYYKLTLEFVKSQSERNQVTQVRKEEEEEEEIILCPYMWHIDYKWMHATHCNNNCRRRECDFEKRKSERLGQ